MVSCLLKGWGAECGIGDEADGARIKLPWKRVCSEKRRGGRLLSFNTDAAYEHFVRHLQ